VDSAAAAQRGAAAELGAGEAQLVAQIPQQRHRRIAVVCPFLSIDLQGCHSVSSSELAIPQLPARVLMRSRPGVVKRRDARPALSAIWRMARVAD
jgi:hypothetical protein